MSKLWASLLLALLMLGGCDEQAQNTTETPKVNTNTLNVSPNTAPQATASDLSVGKALHDKTCISCHDTSMYTREDRKMMDFPSLLSQVKRCSANLETALLEEDVEQIASYLNQAFYHFK